MNNPKKLCLSAALGFFYTPFLCLAQATEESSPPEIVTIVGTRNEASLFWSPYTISVVDIEQYSAHAYRTVPQAFSEIPGVMVQETSMGQGSPYIRGFTGFRNLFLIDGIKLNNSVFREGPNQYWSTVDAYSMKSLEVLNGSASTLYGTDAIGGTVNALTRDPGDTHLGILYRGSTGEHSNIINLEQHFRPSDSNRIMAGITLKEFGNLEGGKALGKQTNVGYDERDLYLKWITRLSDNSDLTFYHQQVTQDDVPRTHTTSAALSWEGTSVGNDLRRNLDQKRSLSYVRYRKQSPYSWADNLNLILSRQNTREERDRIRSNGRQEFQGFDVNTLGLTLQLDKATSYGLWTLGMDRYKDKVDSFSSRNPVQGPVADDSSYTLLDFYIQNQLAIRDNTLVIFGLRETNVALDADKILDPDTDVAYNTSEDWHDVVGNARISHQLIHDSLNLFAGISQSYRTPNLSDYTRFDNARTNEFEIPSMNLSPERYLSFEAGFKWRNERSYLEAAIYRTRIRDMIIRVPTGQVRDGAFEITKKNIGDGFVKGLEIKSETVLTDNLSLKGQATWMDGKVDTYPTSEQIIIREPIDRLMPFTFQAGLVWRPDTSPGFWGEVAVIHADRQDKLSTRDSGDTSRIPPGGTPGYTVFNLYSGLKVGKYHIDFAIDNVFDKDYRIHGSGTNRPGRNFVLTLSRTI